MKRAYGSKQHPEKSIVSVERLHRKPPNNRQQHHRIAYPTHDPYFLVSKHPESLCELIAKLAKSSGKFYSFHPQTPAPYFRVREKSKGNKQTRKVNYISFQRAQWFAYVSKTSMNLFIKQYENTDFLLNICLI